MRYSLATLAAAALFLSPLLSESIRGQQQQQQPERPSVQVGVPEGRAGGGGGARQGGQGQGRGRQAGPAKPAPRNADGRVILGGATPKEKGVWLPGAVVPNP